MSIQLRNTLDGGLEKSTLKFATYDKVTNSYGKKGGATDVESSEDGRFLGHLVVQFSYA